MHARWLCAADRKPSAGSNKEVPFDRYECNGQGVSNGCQANGQVCASHLAQEKPSSADQASGREFSIGTEFLWHLHLNSE